MMGGMGEQVPLRIVNAVAPIRICDNGGWTDTWFAGHGKVFNIAVYPYVEVQVAIHPIDGLPNRIVLDAENYGDRYGFELGSLPGRHPLLEAAVDAMSVPDEFSLEISIFSKVPAGSSTGTSAAASVALIGALDSLTPSRMTAHEVAYAAHRIEVDQLGVQSGIQDQLCATFGGINYIEMFSYPHASVSPISIPNPVLWELERRLVLLFLGRTHISSEVHERVIAELAQVGEDAPQLGTLRRAAEEARDALYAADFPALGRAMTQNTEAQRRLHAGLVSREADAAIEVAAAHGALGWKVNGAGGKGGSITFLSGPDMRAKRRLLRSLGETDPQFQVIPIYLSPYGLRVWQA